MAATPGGEEVASGKLMFVGTKGTVLAMDAAPIQQGFPPKEAWRTTVTKSIRNHVTILALSGPRLFAGARSTVTCLESRTGRALWVAKIEHHAPPAISHGVALLPAFECLLGACFSRVACFDARDGVRLWVRELPALGWGTVHLAHIRGAGLVAAAARNLVAVLRLADGSVVWERSILANAHPVSLAVSPDESVLFAGVGGNVQRFDPATGRELGPSYSLSGSLFFPVSLLSLADSVVAASRGYVWRLGFESAALGGRLAKIYENGLEGQGYGYVISVDRIGQSECIVAVLNGKVARIAPSGETQWKTSLPGTFAFKNGTVLYDASNDIIVAGSGGKLYGLDPASGTLLWVEDLEGLGHGILCVCTETSHMNPNSAGQLTLFAQTHGGKQK